MALTLSQAIERLARLKADREIEQNRLDNKTKERTRAAIAADNARAKGVLTPTLSNRRNYANDQFRRALSAVTKLNEQIEQVLQIIESIEGGAKPAQERAAAAWQAEPAEPAPAPKRPKPGTEEYRVAAIARAAALDEANAKAAGMTLEQWRAERDAEDKALTSR